MNGTDKAIRAASVLLFSNLTICAVADDATAQAAALQVEQDFAQSCVAPYRERLGHRAAHLNREQYKRALFEARADAKASCSTFVQAFERVEQPTAETRALRDARGLLDREGRQKCAEAQAIGEFSRHPETLYRLALCTDDNVRKAALWEEAAEADPEHTGALMFLTGARALDSQTRARYGASLYELTEDTFYRLAAAKAIIEDAIDRGDVAGVLEIRERVRRHLLKRPAEGRCHGGLEHLALEEICFEAIETIAANAASASEALPDSVVQLVGHFFREYSVIAQAPNFVRTEAEVAELLASEEVLAQLTETFSDEPEKLELFKDEAKLASWMRGEPENVEAIDRDARLSQWLGREPWAIRKTRQANRMKAVLEGYPEPLRSSEHYVALADTASVWRDYISSLRRAVELDPRNLRARCALARVLARAGKSTEARVVYQEVAAAEDSPCYVDMEGQWRNDVSPDAAVDFVWMR